LETSSYASTNSGIDREKAHGAAVRFGRLGDGKINGKIDERIEIELSIHTLTARASWSESD
jgi:hypothetical protein